MQYGVNTMDREQAKIFTEKNFTGEEVKTIYPYFNPECIELMMAFGRGEDIKTSDKMIFGQYIFSGHVSIYSIAPKTYMMNGVECIAPMSEKPEVGKAYWFVRSMCIDWTGWGNANSDNKYFELGNCFATEEGVQQTFNAIWGIES
jgi:hypothetical protein